MSKAIVRLVAILQCWFPAWELDGLTRLRLHLDSAI